MHIINNLLKTTLPIVALCLTASCTSGCEDNTVGADDVQMAFTLSVADATTTRAANEGWSDYAPSVNGTPDENAIDMGDLQIRVCDKEGQVVADVEDVHAVKVDGKNGFDYEVTATWRNARADLNRAYKLMVTANCQTSGHSDLSHLSFAWGGDSRQFIPMWGVAPLPTLTLGKSNPLPEGIDMLRAMAKVSVQLRADMVARGYSIGELRMERYNTEGYCLPLLYEKATRTRDIQFANSLHVLSSTVTVPIDFTLSRQLYLPEYDNTSPDAVPTSITVRLSHNGVADDSIHRLLFCHYSSSGTPTGDAYDIQRNHHYTYTIYKESDKIAVSLHVRNWNLRDYGEDIIL